MLRSGRPDRSSHGGCCAFVGFHHSGGRSPTPGLTPTAERWFLSVCYPYPQSRDQGRGPIPGDDRLAGPTAAPPPGGSAAGSLSPRSLATRAVMTFGRSHLTARTCGQWTSISSSRSRTGRPGKQSRGSPRSPLTGASSFTSPRMTPGIATARSPFSRCMMASSGHSENSTN
jgi:hypothetical protein